MNVPRPDLKSVKLDDCFYCPSCEIPCNRNNLKRNWVCEHCETNWTEVARRPIWYRVWARFRAYFN